MSLGCHYFSSGRGGVNESVGKSVTCVGVFPFLCLLIWVK